MKPLFYQDVVLMQGEDVPLSALQSELYSRLHMLFVSQLNENGIQYAVAFPGMRDNGVGRKIRVFAERLEDLVALDIPRICMRSYGMMDYRPPRSVPQGTPLIRYSRKHDQERPEKRRARNEARYEGERLEKALSEIHDKRPLDLPCIWIRSLSTLARDGVSNPYPFYIRTSVADGLASEFNCYGLPLSEGGVPDFA